MQRKGEGTLMIWLPLAELPPHPSSPSSMLLFLSLLYLCKPTLSVAKENKTIPKGIQGDGKPLPSFSLGKGSCATV